MKKLLLTCTCLLFWISSVAQPAIDQLLEKIDQLAFHDLSSISEVLSVEFLRFNSYFQEYDTMEMIGWKLWGRADSVLLLNLVGQERKLERTAILKIQEVPQEVYYQSYFNRPYPLKRKNPRNRDAYEGHRFMPQILIALWLHSRNSDLARHLINEFQEQDPDLLNSMLVPYFGNLYYNEMLRAFASRKRATALKYGRYLGQSMFSDFEYFEQAKLLTHQLECRPEDFRSFRLPENAEWEVMKQVQTRSEQITYLLDRIRLLNCFQPGQPADIDFRDPQTSISFSEISKDHEVSSYDAIYEKYGVINPYGTLLKMDIQINELRLFLPSLRSREFVTSFSYWRDFSSDRQLHSVADIVLDLIYQIAGKRFADVGFLHWSDDRKDLKINKIEEWIAASSVTTVEARLQEILSNSDNWKEVEKAIYEAWEMKLEDLFDLLNNRIGDFQSGSWPSPDGQMMYVLMKTGRRSNVETMRQYLQHQDYWVRLWASLFMIQHEPDSFQASLQVLASVLEQGDQETYRYAIPTMLEIDDLALLQLAEGLLDRYSDADAFFLSMNSNTLRSLLLAGSKKAHKLFLNGLQDFGADPRITSTAPDGKPIEVLVCDRFVDTINNWRVDEYQYEYSWGVSKKKAYAQSLSVWFSRQFELIEQGKVHLIKTDF